jgi:hypothetical protein
MVAYRCAGEGVGHLVRWRLLRAAGIVFYARAELEGEGGLLLTRLFLLVFYVLRWVFVFTAVVWFDGG